MRIVFGTYNIHLKTYSSRELGLTMEDAEKYVFEVKQRIFHVFWIPIFPLYKVFAFGLPHGPRYHAPIEIERAIKNRKEYRTPWYSFALPILALVVLLGIYISESYDSYESKSNLIAQKEAYVNNTKNGLDKLEEGDVLVMADMGFWTNSPMELSAEKYLVCIDKVLKSGYEVHTKFLDYDSDPMYGTLEGQRILGDSMMMGDEMKTLTKADIQQFLGTFTNNGSYSLGGGKVVRGHRFVYHHTLKKNEPNLFPASNSWSNNALNLDITYFGPVARIIKAVPVSGITGNPSYSSVLANEANVKFNSTIDLPGTGFEDDFCLELTIESESGKLFKYRITKTGYSIFTKRIN